MKDLILTNSAELIVSSSRTLQETLQIHNGNSTYGVMAALLNNNMPYLDKFAEEIGYVLADKAVKNKYDNQYFNEKYGSFKNFFTRNIYLDQQKREKLENERSNVGFYVGTASEIGMKLLSRGITKYFAEKDKVKKFEKINLFLSSYVLINSENTNIDMATVELTKIRRTFPISNSQKEKLRKQTIELYGTTRELSDIYNTLALTGEEDNEYLKNIAYMLYAIHCQKYRDLYSEKEPQRHLLEFYSMLGYTGNYAKLILEENAATYNEIANTQVNYLKLSRALTNNILINLPEIDADSLKAQSRQMAKYDPYSKRRAIVQSGVKATFSTIVTKRPDIAIEAAATALSQIKLENNDTVTESLESSLKKYGIDNPMLNLILSQRKCIKSYINDNNLTT